LNPPILLHKEACREDGFSGRPSPLANPPTLALPSPLALHFLLCAKQSLDQEEAM